MFSIVSFSLLVAGLLFFPVAFRLYFSFKKTKDQNIKYFLSAVVFLTITFLYSSAPGIWLKGSNSVGFVLQTYPFFIFLALAYFGRIPLAIIRDEKSSRIFFSIFWL